MSRQVRERLAANDTFVIRGTDRLGATQRQRAVARDAKKFNIAILDIPVLNARSGVSDELMRYIVSDVLLQLQACIDRGKMEYLSRQVTEGIRAAREEGVRVGRRPKERPPAFDAAYEAWAAGKLSGRQAARQLGVSHATFQRWAREKETEGERAR